MRRGLLALACAAGAIGLLGCGEDGEGGVNVSEASTTGTTTVATTTTPSHSDVPAGVAAQYHKAEEEIGAEGGEQSVGPWRIAYIVEPAEGWFEQRAGKLRWRAPRRGETNHIEILPFEKGTGRLVPDVPVTLEILDARGRRVARKTLAPYHAEFFHYAENFALPGSGKYTLRAGVGSPTFRRHGERSDRPALADGATVRFEDVEISTAEEAGGDGH